jgi:hypothetical protein
LDLEEGGGRSEEGREAGMNQFEYWGRTIFGRIQNHLSPKTFSPFLHLFFSLSILIYCISNRPLIHLGEIYVHLSILLEIYCITLRMKKLLKY